MDLKEKARLRRWGGAGRSRPLLLFFWVHRGLLPSLRKELPMCPPLLCSLMKMSQMLSTLPETIHTQPRATNKTSTAPVLILVYSAERRPEASYTFQGCNRLQTFFPDTPGPHAPQELTWLQPGGNISDAQKQGETPCVAALEISENRYCNSCFHAPEPC